LKKHSDFFEMVYEVVKLIPKGRVTTYGAIAKYLGAARSSRMVGWAMNNSHTLKEPLPAHRVVNRVGVLTGKHHFENSSKMQHLLEEEDVIVENDQIKNFNEVFWNPEIEIQII
jgi:methylated-DNA-protein-cysteine methyltransferase related protein